MSSECSPENTFDKYNKPVLSKKDKKKKMKEKVTALQKHMVEKLDKQSKISGF